MTGTVIALDSTILIPAAIFLVVAIPLIGVMALSMRSKLHWKQLAEKHGLKFTMIDKELTSYMSIKGELDGVYLTVSMYQRSSVAINTLFAVTDAAARVQGSGPVVYGGQRPGIPHIEVCVPFSEGYQVMDEATRQSAIEREAALREFEWATEGHSGYLLTPKGLAFRCLWKGGNAPQVEEAMLKLVSLRKKVSL